MNKFNKYLTALFALIFLFVRFSMGMSGRYFGEYIIMFAISLIFVFLEDNRWWRSVGVILIIVSVNLMMSDRLAALKRTEELLNYTQIYLQEHMSSELSRSDEVIIDE